MQQINIQSHKDNITFACEASLAKLAHYGADVLFIFFSVSPQSTLGFSAGPQLWWSSSARSRNPRRSPRESPSQILRRSCAPSLPRRVRSSRSTLKFQETPFCRPLNISVHITLRTTMSPLRLNANFRSSAHSLPGNPRWHQGSETLLLCVNFREPHSSPGKPLLVL